MRIAVLTNAYPPDTPGGASRIAEEQVRLLEAAGETVRVWHPKIDWFSQPALVRLGKHLSDLHARRRLVDDIVAWKPDVLVTHNLTGCGFATPKMIQQSGTRWVHILHDIQLFEPSGQAASVERMTGWQRVWSWLRRRSLGRPDLVVSPTQWLMQQHQRRGFFTSIGTAVLPNLGPVIERTTREPHEPLRLLFIGRMTEDKGAFLLGRLASLFSIPFEMDLVGSGEPFIHDDRFTFHGPLAHDEALSLMRSSDVLLVPSQIVENQPTVILEAASFGLPVVASKIGGVEETLGAAGVLCRPTVVEDWVQAIQRLHEAQTFRTQSEKMFALALTHEPFAYAQRFLSLLKSNR